uniref:Hint domain-containing protein n=1 Tax=Acrobeloides nanus TaxID=290746 RepID=A0A914D8R3_9BILA
MLKITEKHLIYKADCIENESHEVNKKLIFADELNIGDCLYVVNEEKTSVNVRQIVKIDIITEMGIFAPETENGDIVVNDIIASCYTDIKKESLVKTIPSVHNFIKRITGWFFDENTDEKVKISLGIFNIAMIIIEEIIPTGILTTSEMF